MIKGTLFHDDLNEILWYAENYFIIDLLWFNRSLCIISW